MINDKYFSIIDYGSSKIRISVYDSTTKNLKYINENDNINNKKESSIIIEDLIKRGEKTIDQHLNSIILMLDSKEFSSIDLSLKKSFEKKIFEINDLKFLIQEAKYLIENSYKNKKIIHIIINKYFFDGFEYLNLPKENITINDLIIQIKFLLIPNTLSQKTIDYFKNMNLAISKTYCSSYVKSLNYLNNFERYQYKYFLDIGYKKTCLTIYNHKKLIFINYIPVGGNHISSDISKILKIDIDEAEEIKKKYYNNNISFSDFSNDEQVKDIENKKHNNKLINQIIYARIEEIINLSFKNFYLLEFLINKEDSILIFTGEGSKILNKNSIDLKEEFNFFSEMNFFEENSELICNSGMKYFNSEDIEEVEIIPKKTKKKGFFARLFYYFN